MDVPTLGSRAVAFPKWRRWYVVIRLGPCSYSAYMLTYSSPPESKSEDPAVVSWSELGIIKCLFRSNVCQHAIFTDGSVEHKLMAIFYLSRLITLCPIIRHLRRSDKHVCQGLIYNLSDQNAHPGTWGCNQKSRLRNWRIALHAYFNAYNAVTHRLATRGFIS